MTDGTIKGYNYTLGISRILDSRTSLDASITSNRYDEFVPSAYNSSTTNFPYDGNTHQIIVRATRKF